MTLDGSSLSGESRLTSLRDLRLVLLEESILPDRTLTSVARLRERVDRLFAGRGLLAFLVRLSKERPFERLLEGALPQSLERESGPAGEARPAWELSEAGFRAALGSREAVYLKPSEIGQLFCGVSRPDAVSRPGVEEPPVEEEGEDVRRVRASLGPASGLLVPITDEVVLALVGLDLGPEDLGPAEELGQFLLLLHQTLDRQTRDAAQLGESRDRTQELSRQIRRDTENLSNLLRASQDLRTTTDLQGTLERIGQLIVQNLGFDIVAISVVEGKLVHNKVLLGVDDGVRARYGGLTSALEDLEPFLQERFRISSSYYVPRTADVYTEQNRYCLYEPAIEERPDGMWQGGDNFLTPLRDGEGRLLGVISLDAPRDGAPPDQEKAQLLELYANHATLVIENAQQVGELLKLNQELQELDRIRTEFIANISHQLRTPIASVLGYAHLLLEHGSANLTERQRHFLSVLAKNTERLSSLVDTLVDISELNSEDPTLKCEPLDLRDIYREVLARLETQIRVHRLELREHLGTEPLLVLGDRHRLRQVFFAILSNAVLFNREQGLIEVTMERSSPAMISVRVCDTGPGLSKDKLREILDRFYQVDHAQVPLDFHSAMGLSIAYKHVRAHRGNLVLQSEEGSGTRLTVTLPASGGF
jgi:signal transduction histidine kinase